MLKLILILLALIIFGGAILTYLMYPKNRLGAVRAVRRPGFLV